MADIFTLLLVFLLKTLAQDLSAVTPSDSIQLPEANISDRVNGGHRIEIASGKIHFDDTDVMTLKDFQFENGELDDRGMPKSLAAAFTSKKEELRNTHNDQQQLLVLADSLTPFSTIKAVLSSATENGFGNFKLIVINK